MKKNKYINYTFYTVAFFLMLSIFSTNLFGILNPAFKDFQKDSERLILDRIILTKNEGILENSGLAGIYGEWNDTRLNHEMMYINNSKVDKKLYVTYQSHIGGQSMIYSVLDMVLPFDSKNKLLFFQLLTASLSSMFFMLFLVWVNKHFNIITSIISLILIVSSFWIIIFSNKMWWNLWSFYLPFIFVLFYLDKENIDKINTKKIIFYSFLLVFIKCFISGYEYITTTLIMFTTPIIFYHILYKWEYKKTIQLFFKMFIGSILGFLLSIGILIFQINNLIQKENNLSGFEYIYQTLLRRSYDKPDSSKGILYFNSMKSSVWETVQLYLNGPIYKYKTSNGNVYEISFLTFILFFAIITIIYYLIKKNSFKTNKKNIFSLIIMFWISIIAPLSWFVIFKGHSYIHTHINFIVWYMPFTLLGYVFLGQIISEFIHKQIKKWK